MLEELKNLKFPGKKEDILFFLQSVIGIKTLTLDDIRTICSHAPGKYQLAVEPLIIYCRCFNWIKHDYQINLDTTLKRLVNSSEEMNDELISRTVDILFAYGIFKPELFFYDFARERFVFKNECLLLCFSSVRNVLVSQCFFEVERNQRIIFSINPRYESLLATHCKKSKATLTLKQLEERLEGNAKAGAMAEKFALEYERKRLANSFLSEKVRIISNIDVSAGYDIVSFESIYSSEYDRFIEVKAISEKEDFYWSRNEFEVARIKGAHYYLYLVNLCKIKNEGYEPFIIINPSKEVMDSSDWHVEAQTYHVRHI